MDCLYLIHEEKIVEPNSHSGEYWAHIPARRAPEVKLVADPREAVITINLDTSGMLVFYGNVKPVLDDVPDIHPEQAIYLTCEFRDRQNLAVWHSINWAALRGAYIIHPDKVEQNMREREELVKWNEVEQTELLHRVANFLEAEYTKKLVGEGYKPST